MAGLSLEDVRSYVKLKLGAGIIRVELEDRHIDAATNEALRVYSRHRPLLRYKKIELVENIVEYPLEMDTLGVYKMDFVHRQVSLAVIEDIFHRRYYEPIHDLDTYTHYLQYIDTLKRVLSIEPDWHFERPSNPHQQPILYIHAPHQANTMLALAITIPKRRLSQVPYLHEDWVQRYALAFCKEILGRVRGKWANIPSPGGGQGLDAGSLLAESSNEFGLLDQEVKGWQTDLPPMWA
jgi:hypothetical protein